MFDPLLFGLGRNMTCEGCGTRRFDVIDREQCSPEIAPFVRTDVVHVINTVGVCSECYMVLCGQCAPGGRCPRCGFGLMLTPDCPPDPPPWWRLRKRLKWQMVFGGA